MCLLNVHILHIKNKTNVKKMLFDKKKRKKNLCQGHKQIKKN